uniref:Uncharacterized protein n=1 Tax=Sphaerodactylus townsendi TaxID=933632 RepID=A0ACB8EGH1_9SAUR
MAMPSRSPVAFEGRALKKAEISMPARDQNSKTRRMNNKKPQKRGQKATRKQKGLQPKKQKKRQATNGRKVLNLSSPQILATKILQDINVRMETKARGLMTKLLMDMVYDHALKEMASQSQNKQLPAIDPAEVQAIFQEAVVTVLAKDSAEPTSMLPAPPLISSRPVEEST